MTSSISLLHSELNSLIAFTISGATAQYVQVEKQTAQFCL